MLRIGLRLLFWTGRAGEECAKADGRELWVLGEMYRVRGMQEWLLEEGVHMGSLVAVYEFGLVPEGVERGVVVERCHEVMEEQGWAVDESFLCGVSKEVVRGLAVARGKQGKGKRLEVKTTHMEQQLNLTRQQVQQALQVNQELQELAEHQEQMVPQEQMELAVRTELQEQTARRDQVGLMELVVVVVQTVLQVLMEQVGYHQP